MLAGGICDQVGGGFARYAVDATWLVPHFEKMLYDNALLARAYLHGFQAHGPRALARDVRADARVDAPRDARPRGRLLVGARRRLRRRGGPLLRLVRRRSSARSLDDAGLASDADDLVAYWGVSAAGNFEGQNILHLAARRRDGAAPDRTRGGRAKRFTRIARSASGRASTTSGSPRGTRSRSLRLPRRAPSSAASTSSTPHVTRPAFVWESLRDRGRQASSHLEGRRGEAPRLPRGSRVRRRGLPRPL